MRRHSFSIATTLVLLLLSAAGPTRAELTAGYQAYAGADYAHALDVLTPLAQQNDPIAAYYVGVMLAEGKGTAADPAQAALWLTRAAELGHAAAQLALALAYENGYGVPQDYRRAAEWMRAAAEGGNADAQYYLGRYHRDGRGLLQSDALAYEWIHRSIEYDSSHERFLDALLYLGAALEWGRGVRYDLVGAYKWFALAASYSIDDARIYNEASRAMDALALRMSTAELAEARRAAQVWREGQAPTAARR